ncbi:hypothetical protein [Pedobacter steynii]|uniref:hypothetical protein n=1 Tax=Pedobacter steynii TaxID=430522 RepID=UPI0012F74FBF|nr:hypothetical protein [Pedobacter steynii]
MKKLIIMMAFLLFVSGASSNRPTVQRLFVESYHSPIRKKLDSINLKAAELELLIKKL